MASESSADEPGTPTTNDPTAEAATTPITQPAEDATASSAAPQDPPFPFYPGQDGASNGGPPQDNTHVESAGGGGMGVSVPYPPLPVYPYGNVMSGPPPMTRPKRTQCKNACTNCQKACKKCDDNRPCQRCIRYGTTETCVDSKRKERRKGVKRGPYKKRDSKGSNASADDEGSGIHPANTSHGPPPNMPYVGPVGYPPGMWSSYAPTGPNGKLEGGAYYQPVFALTPVGGQPPHGGDGESAGGGSEAPHFPVGFYPATFISYPGPYPPYPIPQGQGTHQGFHYPYPPPGLFQPRQPHANQGSATTTDQSTSSSSADAHAKNASSVSATVEGDKKNKGDDKGTDAEPQVNGKAKVAETKADHRAAKDSE